MRCALIVTMTVMVSLGSPALARQQSFWIEKVAIIAVGQGICGMPVSDGGAMQTAIGSAMIELAISKDDVIARARKRAHFIVGDLQKHRTRNSFCHAFSYYLQNGYPR